MKHFDWITHSGFPPPSGMRDGWKGELAMCIRFALEHTYPFWIYFLHTVSKFLHVQSSESSFRCISGRGLKRKRKEGRREPWDILSCESLPATSLSVISFSYLSYWSCVYGWLPFCSIHLYLQAGRLSTVGDRAYVDALISQSSLLPHHHHLSGRGEDPETSSSHQPQSRWPVVMRGGVQRHLKGHGFPALMQMILQKASLPFALRIQGRHLSSENLKCATITC